MTFVRPARSSLPPDERTIRLRWITPGARILRDSDVHVLAGGPPEMGPRKSTPPSPEKAALFRMREAVEEMAIDLLYVVPFAVLAAFGWIAYLALC